MFGDFFNDFMGSGGRRRNGQGPLYGRPYDDSFIDPRHHHGYSDHTGDPFDPFRDPFFSHGMIDPFREMERTMREADNMMKAFMGSAFQGPSQFGYDPFALEGQQPTSPRERMLKRSPSWDGVKIEEITDESDVTDSKSKTNQPIVTHPNDSLVPSYSQPERSAPQEHRHSQPQPVIRGFASVYSRSFTGDGRVQEYQSYRDSSGNYTEKNARSIDGKTVAVTKKKKGRDAQPEIEEDYINLDGSELEQFEKEWNQGSSRVRRALPQDATSSYPTGATGGPLRIEGSYSGRDRPEGNKRTWKDYLPKIF